MVFAGYSHIQALTQNWTVPPKNMTKTGTQQSNKLNFDNVMTKFIINKRTDTWKTDIKWFLLQL